MKSRKKLILQQTNCQRRLDSLTRILSERRNDASPHRISTLQDPPFPNGRKRSFLFSKRLQNSRFLLAELTAKKEKGVKICYTPHVFPRPGSRCGSPRHLSEVKPIQFHVCRSSTTGCGRLLGYAKDSVVPMITSDYFSRFSRVFSLLPTFPKTMPPSS